MPETVTRPCARCTRTFIPTTAQLGQERRGPCPLYCSDECYRLQKAERMRRWWRSEEGRKYARDRRAQAAARGDDTP